MSLYSDLFIYLPYMYSKVVCDTYILRLVNDRLRLMIAIRYLRKLEEFLDFIFMKKFFVCNKLVFTEIF